MKGSELKNLLYHPRTDKLQVLGHFKSNHDIDSFEKAIRPALAHPITKKLLYASPLPKEYKDLRKSRIVPHSENLEGEIAWILFSLEEYSDSLNEYLKLKEQFDNQILLEDYIKSQEVLETINRNICVSIWGLENTFLLAENSKGSEYNWESLSMLAKIIEDPFILFLIENFSKKAESNISYFRYRNIINNQIADSGGLDSFGEYVIFRLNHPAYSGYKSFSFFLDVESISSVIDRYNLLVDVLFELISYPKDHNLEIAQKTTNKLLSFISHDSRLIQLNNILSPEDFIKINQTESFILLLDEYTKGNFEYCIKHIPQSIKTFPSSFEYYELYSKSLIEGKKAFSPTGISKLIDLSLKHIYNVLARNEFNSDSTEVLLKQSLSSFSSSWGRQLFSFISSKAESRYDFGRHEAQYILNSRFNNPRLMSVADHWAANCEAIRSSFTKSFNSISVRVNNYIGTSNSKLLFGEQDITSSRKSLYIGRAIVNEKKYSEIRNHFEEILNLKSISPITEEESIYHLYNSYIALEDYHKAFALYVDSYLRNQFFVLRIDTDHLLSILVSLGDGIASKSIDLPIFFHLADSDNYDKYVAYDIFMEELKIARPTELPVNISKEKVRLFLWEVCTSEVLHHSMHFESSDDITTERLKILQRLLILDSENESVYIREITELTQETKIKKAIREVNKGRITVNVQRLKSIEATNIKEGFRRYQEIVSISKDKDWIAVDSSSKKIKDFLNSLYEDNIKNKVVHLRDPAFISFKQMFIEIRDKYLFSKEYGLDGYLSTRIRHGTLLNHIRSVFESLNLISQKDKEGAYVDIPYWNDRIPMPLSRKKSEIQSCFKSFSRKVDEFTEYLIKELIQIRTEKSNEKQFGLFNYGLSQEEIAQIFKVSRENIHDYDSFVDFVFDFLEENTRILLKGIRELISFQIKDKYEMMISDLQKGIREILEDIPFADLTTSITKCSTDIRNELGNIAEWFDLSNPSTDLVLDIKTLIQTGVEITNTIYPHNQLNPKILAETEIPLKGTIHFIYIIRILLDNIIEHSGLSGSDLDIEIKTSFVDDTTLRLSFSNNLSETVDTEEIRSNLNKALMKWNQYQREFDKSNTEGGSGLEKIKRILAVDMGSKFYNFGFVVDSEIVTINIDLSVKIHEYANE